MIKLYKFSALLLSMLVATSVEARSFSSASQIPAPERVGLNTPLNTNVVPSGAATNQTMVQLPKESLASPKAVTKPIKLDEASLKQQSVLISNDDTHLVNLSQSLVNRISTPFYNPTVMSNGGMNIQIIGQDVYIEMITDQPTGVFIREDESVSSNSPVASLTLIPKLIPPQNVSLVLDHTVKSKSASNRLKLASDYEDGVRVSFSKAVMGQTPEGFSRSNSIDKTVARVGGVMLRPQIMYSGVDQNIFVYQAENVTGRTIELVEPSFHFDGVRAVSFYPEIKLAPNQRTNVYIMADVGEASVND